MARRKQMLSRFKPIRGYKSSQNQARKRVTSKPPTRCKSKARSRSISPWRSGWRETIRNMSTWTEDKGKVSKESSMSKVSKTPTQSSQNVNSSKPGSPNKSSVPKDGPVCSNATKSAVKDTKCSVKPQTLKTESKHNKPLLKHMDQQVLIHLFPC